MAGDNEFDPEDGGDGESDFEVGYKKPPKAKQFQKGNRHGKGRKKGTKNLATLVIQAAQQQILVKEGGKTTKKTALDVTLLRQFRKAMAGDSKAAAMVVALVERHEPRSADKATRVAAVEKDLTALRQFLAFEDQLEAWREAG